MKTPLTLDKFDEFFRLLPEFADSEKNWTINFSAKREKARKEYEPFKEKVRELENKSCKTKEKVKQLKIQSFQNKDEISKLQKKIVELDGQIKENRSKAETIENAIYDIKAVNPNAKDTSDKRTPQELLKFIEDKSNEVNSALQKLFSIV